MGSASHAHHLTDVLQPLPSEGGSIEELRIASTTGGLVIVGPTLAPLAGMASLLASPEVAPIEARAVELTSWDTAGAAIITLTRDVSGAMRNGKTAVVYLDSHMGKYLPIPAECHDFVCSRLSRIVVGLADAPPYIALHGQKLARAILVDGSGEPAPTMGVITDGLPVVRLTDVSMFPGTPVAICSSNRSATAAAHALDWFEARRV